MTLKLRSLAGVLVLVTSGVASAQTEPAAQQTTSTTTQTPTRTQTTTTHSSTTATPGTTATPAQAQTTTTKSTTTTPTDSATGEAVGPSQSSTSTSTTSAVATQPATPADVKKGVSVYDEKGALVGKIESTTAKAAVLSTGTSRAEVPLSSFAKNDKGLVIGMTKADIDAQAKKSAPKSK